MLHETVRAKVGGRDRATGLAASLQSFSFWIMFAVGVGLAEFLAAWFAIALLRPPGGGPGFFWPAAGVAAGILICMGPAARLPVLAGTFVGAFWANVLGDRTILSAIVFSISNAVQAVLISELIHRFFSQPARLDSLQRVMGFVAAAAIGPAVSGIGLTAAYYLFLRSSMPPGLWTSWFAAHLVGIIAVAPLLIGIFSIARDPPTRREFIEGSAALILVTVLSGLVIRLPTEVWTGEVMIATVFPLMLWIAARCAPVFAAAASFIWTVTIVWTTIFEIGVFGNPGIAIDDRIFFARASTLAVSLCALVIAALFAERRRHEAVLLEARKQAELARKQAELANRAKSTFLAAASHDLRQPLQTLSLLQRTLEPHIQDAEGRRMLAGISRSVGTMRGMLNSLLDINRLESGVLVPSISTFPVNDVFDSVAADFLEIAEEKGLKLRVVHSGLMIRSDQHMLEEMTRNLVSNAIRYTDKGTVLVGCRRADDKVRIEVWDSGAGISREHIARIFEEYYQISQSVKEEGGFGLGLAIVQRLGKLLGHHVDVRSVPGEGSCFSVEVPMANESAPAERPSTALPDIADTPLTGTILLIEDESSVRRALDRLLRMKGLGVLSAASANEALSLITKKGMRPDLVISDHNLPGKMNGVECIEAIRAALAWKIPAIVLTGDIRSRVIKSIGTHDLSVVVKPVQAEELLKLIRLHASSNVHASGIGYR